MARMPGHPGQEFSDEHSTNTLSVACVERVTGIEPALSAWEADVLPLNYTRESAVQLVAHSTQTVPVGRLSRRHRTGPGRLPACCSPTGTSEPRSHPAACRSTLSSQSS